MYIYNSNKTRVIIAIIFYLIVIAIGFGIKSYNSNKGTTEVKSILLSENNTKEIGTYKLIIKTEK